jgi:transcriptional regulator with XRE-family HTH domain
MSTNLCSLHDPNLEEAVASLGPGNGRPVMHQLRKARQREKLSARCVAHRLGISVAELKAQEAETADLPLSVLHRWAAALDVPITELLVEPTSELSLPLLNRARLVRAMKTVQSILELAGQTRVKRMAQMLAEQLVEIMPELSSVSAWNSVGYRRKLSDLGRAAEHVIRLRDEDYGEL